MAPRRNCVLYISGGRSSGRPGRIVVERLGTPTSPRRHVATGMAGFDATHGHAPEDLAIRSSPPYRWTPCREIEIDKGELATPRQPTWRPMLRRRCAVRFLPASSKHRTFWVLSDLTQYDARITAIPHLLGFERFDTVQHLPRRVVHRLLQGRGRDAVDTDATPGLFRRSRRRSHRR